VASICFIYLFTFVTLFIPSHSIQYIRIHFLTYCLQSYLYTTTTTCMWRQLAQNVEGSRELLKLSTDHHFCCNSKPAKIFDFMLRLNYCRCHGNAIMVLSPYGCYHWSLNRSCHDMFSCSVWLVLGAYYGHPCKFISSFRSINGNLETYGRFPV
jgi:hypothetical protein